MGELTSVHCLLSLAIALRKMVEARVACLPNDVAGQRSRINSWLEWTEGDAQIGAFSDRYRSD